MSTYLLVYSRSLSTVLGCIKCRSWRSSPSERLLRIQWSCLGLRAASSRPHRRWNTGLGVTSWHQWTALLAEVNVFLPSVPSASRSSARSRIWTATSARSTRAVAGASLARTAGQFTHGPEVWRDIGTRSTSSDHRTVPSVVRASSTSRLTSGGFTADPPRFRPAGRKSKTTCRKHKKRRRVHRKEVDHGVPNQPETEWSLCQTCALQSCTQTVLSESTGQLCLVQVLVRLWWLRRADNFKRQFHSSFVTPRRKGEVRYLDRLRGMTYQGLDVTILKRTPYRPASGVVAKEIMLSSDFIPTYNVWIMKYLKKISHLPV